MQDQLFERGFAEAQAELQRRHLLRRALVAATLTVGAILPGAECMTAPVPGSSDALHLATDTTDTLRPETSTTTTMLDVGSIAMETTTATTLEPSTTAEQTTTEAPTSSSSSSSSSSTEAPSTTTTLLHPWDAVKYDSDSCNKPHNSVITISDANNAPVPIQISADYLINGRKVDAFGNIMTNPLGGYSWYAYANLNGENITQFCLQAPAGAVRYYEIYPKAIVNNNVVTSYDNYGGAMAHRAGPNVAIALPSTCNTKTGKAGQTGNLIVDGYTQKRLVAWSMGGATPGFGVIDNVQEGKDSVDRLEGLAGGQFYTVQPDLADDAGHRATVVIKNVPEQPCKDTHIGLDFPNGQCVGTATIDGNTINVACGIISGKIG